MLFAGFLLPVFSIPVSRQFALPSLHPQKADRKVPAEIFGGVTAGHSHQCGLPILCPPLLIPQSARGSFHRQTDRNLRRSLFAPVLSRLIFRRPTRARAISYFRNLR